MCLNWLIIINLTQTARKALDLGHSLVKEGITTDEIDKAVHKFIIDNDAYPSPLNYYNFPKSLCVNDLKFILRLQ
jgi:methionine aminopeptidase